MASAWYFGGGLFRNIYQLTSHMITRKPEQQKLRKKACAIFFNKCAMPIFMAKRVYRQLAGGDDATSSK